MLRWLKRFLFWIIGIGGHQDASSTKGVALMEDNQPTLERMSEQELQISAAEINREMQLVGHQSRLHQRELTRINEMGPSMPIGQQQASAIAAKKLAKDIKASQDNITRLGKRLELINGLHSLQQEAKATEEDPISKVIDVQDVETMRREVLRRRGEISVREKSLYGLVAALDPEDSGVEDYDPEVDEILDSWRTATKEDAALLTQELVEKYGARVEQMPVNERNRP